jgi:Leucine rich repeat
LIIIFIFFEISQQSTDCEWRNTQETKQDTHLNCSQSQTERTARQSWSWTFKTPVHFIWNGVHNLWINRKRITSFEKGIFAKFTNIRKIDLSENELSAIEFDEFANNTKLGTLDVSKNQISEIKSIERSTEINIISLMIQDNALTDISELCKLKKVKSLNLSRNRGLDYSTVTFNCWSELTYLYLAETGLKNLNHNYRVLVGCNKLQYLDMSDNALGILCFGHFPAFLELTNLNIRNNNLFNLDVFELKRKCQVLRSIVIDSNNWSCSYYRENLKNLLEKSGITGRIWIDNACLEYSQNPEVKSCPKIESNSTDLEPEKQKEAEDIKSTGLLFFPFWIFIVLDLVLFITVLVLVRFSRV